MKYQYCLKIRAKDHTTAERAHSIFAIKDAIVDENIWKYILVEGPHDEHIHFIDVFVQLLKNNFDRLAKLGISMGDISAWLYYEYDGQCNLEFSPDQLKTLGDFGIALCISCWQSEDEGQQTDKCCPK